MRGVRATPAALALVAALGAPPAGAGTAGRGPEVVRRVAAEYPAWARGAGLGTSVEVRVQVGTDGRARRVVVVPYSVRNDIMSRRLRASFDSAAVASVRQWGFRPALRGDRPVVAWMRVEVPFEDPGAAARGPRDTLAKAKR
ncbi:MAG: TonB family protein [Candidatus Eisenbacteria bacterium]